jgi:hypothetical protein
LHHLTAMPLAFLFVIAVLLCSIHCVIPAQAGHIGHQHGTTGHQDQNHKICGVPCTGVIQPTVPSFGAIDQFVLSIDWRPRVIIRPRDKWLFWVQPRAPPPQ